jgi:hypothetical protein
MIEDQNLRTYEFRYLGRNGYATDETVQAHKMVVADGMVMAVRYLPGDVPQPTFMVPQELFIRAISLEDIAAPAYGPASEVRAADDVPF